MARFMILILIILILPTNVALQLYICLLYTSDLRPSYLMKEAGAFLMTRGISGVAVWLLMVVMVALGEGRGFLYEMFCKMVSSAVNLVANYIFSKLWIFKKRSESKGKQQ